MTERPRSQCRHQARAGLRSIRLLPNCLRQFVHSGNVNHKGEIVVMSRLNRDPFVTRGQIRHPRTKQRLTSCPVFEPFGPSPNRFAVRGAQTLPAMAVPKKRDA